MGITNQTCMSVYQARNLNHISWDIDSTDTAANTNKASFSAALKTETEAKLAAGTTKLIYLFHDIKLITAQNFEAFIGVIDTAITGKDHSPKFLATAAPNPIRDGLLNPRWKRFPSLSGH